MRHPAFEEPVPRATLIDWYRAARERTRMLFDSVDDDAYLERPIPLRNPIVFYEGHIPAFSVNTLIKRALGRPGIDDRLEQLFARGIDPGDEAAVPPESDAWPSRPTVAAYAREADALIEDALGTATLDDDCVDCLRGGEAVFTLIEHELMHQETLLYILHCLDGSKKRVLPQGTAPSASRERRESVEIPGGRVTLGRSRDSGFGWDNEFDQFFSDVETFRLDRFNVTNGDYLAFLNATSLPPPHFWIRVGSDWHLRGAFNSLPLPLDAPVYVTQHEARAYAAWRGARLMTEAEYHRAAFGTPGGDERRHPWGDALPGPEHGNFGFTSFDPVAVGSFPAGQSAWGIHDLVGNGWEWTSSLFEPFNGFAPMPSYPEYSADFFDGEHFVMKGASPVTPRELVRRSFRNWFRPNYPYAYATFRCAWDAKALP